MRISSFSLQDIYSPYSLRDKVDRELECLLKAGVISPIEFSNWAAPIVPVVKSDGSIHICGDYKVTLNAVSKLEEYPLPRMEDLFVALSGEKVFSKLDLSHAYQQIVLEEDTKNLLSLTHRRVYFGLNDFFWYLFRPHYFSMNN